MTTREEQARLFNEAIAQGLTEDQALAAAGITNAEEFTYAFGTGQLEPAALGPPKRPNETIVPAGQSIEYGDEDDDEDEVISRTTPVSSSVTTTSQETVTGGSVTTTRVTPTTYKDTTQSNALQAEADALAAQKEQRAAALRAEGKTGAEILRDSEYRALSRQQQAKESEVYNAKEVDQVGAVTVVTTPGADQTSSGPTVDEQQLTTNTGDDPTAEQGELTEFVANGGPIENTEPAPQDNQFVFDENGELLPADSAAAERVLAEQAEPVDDDPQANQFVFDENGELIPADSAAAEQVLAEQADPQPDPYEVDGAGIGLTEEEIQEQDNPNLNGEAITQAARERAYIQQALEIQRAQTSGVDWRVKLSLASGADYLYKDPGLNQQGILWPLAVTNGVVFPYTPTISTSYTANYNTYDLTHSNYRGYFYQNSYVDEITLTATFTAQDTSEANYLLAVIHFFRSVTKMFYGQDANRGAPPPLVFLQGLGEFQFNLHPCVVRTFNYNLPSDVDYIRARVASINGTNLQYRRDRSSVATNPLSGIFGRLTAAGLKQGALRTPPPPPTLGTGSPTYVPTKMEITIGLLPIQTREQVSKQFSVKQFASGDLLKGGFW